MVMVISFFSASKPIIALRGGCFPVVVILGISEVFPGASTATVSLFSSWPRSRRSHQVLCENSPTGENVQCILRNDLFDNKSLINSVRFMGDYLNVDPRVPCANGVV